MKRVFVLRCWCVFFVFCFFLSSCSSLIVEKGLEKVHSVIIPDNVRTLYIPLFLIEEISLDQVSEMIHDVPSVITEKVQRGFTHQKRFVLQKKKNEADLVLQGVINKFKTEPWTYSIDGSDTIEDVYVLLEVSLTLMDLKNGVVIFEDQVFERSQVLYVRGTWEPRLSALYQITDLLSQDIFSFILGQSLS